MRSKWTKALLSAFIVICLCMPIIGTLNVNAAGEITRAEWLSALVDTFEMTVEDDEYPDNYFNDLDPSSEYYYKMLLATQFGLIDVEAGENVYPDEPVTREFAASTLNFCLGFQLDEDTEYTFLDVDDVENDVAAQVAVDHNWLQLIDGEFLPNRSLTEGEKDTMLDDAVQIWKSTEIDENHEDVYELADGIKEVPEYCSVYLLDDGRLYIVESPIAINKGDRIAVHLNGIPCVYDVSNVEKIGEDIVVDGTGVDTEDAFDTLDVEGELDASALEFGEIPEGIEVEINGESVDSQSSLKKTSLSNRSKKRKDKIEISVSGEYEVSKGNTIKVKAKYTNFKIEHSFHLTK